MGEVALGQRDGEPDIFTISAGDLNAKFYFSKDKSPIFIERTDLMIEVYYNYSTFEGFVITDTNGTRYYFGKVPGKNVAWEKTSYSSSNSSAISSWYLLLIESQDRNYQISFDYKEEYYSYKSISSCEKAISRCIYTGSAQNGGNTTDNTSLSCAGSSANSKGTYYTLVNVEGLRLNSITAGVTKVTFGAATLRTDTEKYKQVSQTASRLDNIDISSGSGSYCTRYEFSYDYFQSMKAGDPETRRLKLTQLQKKECSSNSALELPTKFTYHGPVSNGAQFLPDRLSKAIDHWGFYNGVEANNSAKLNIPTSSGINPAGRADVFNSPVDRNSNEDKMKLGVLEKITYPTGGSTTFSFEANTINGEKPGITQTVNPKVETSPSSMGGENCGFKPASGVITLPVGSSATATYSFVGSSVFFPNGGACPNDQVRNVNLKILTKKNDDDKYETVILQKFFNLSDLIRSNSENLPLSSLGKFTEGKKYRIVLETTNAWGSFAIKYTGKSIPTIVKVGGLRIKQIRTSDGLDQTQDMVKTYNYNLKYDPSKSSGELYNQPKYVHQIDGSGISLDNGLVSTNNLKALVYTDQSIVPLYSFSGYHIGYKNVRETYTAIHEPS
jgi:hypothetical protein